MATFVPNLATRPFAPGESPFAIKGTSYKAHMAYVEANVPGGVAAMKAGLADERYAAFFDQPFLASTLYDLCPLVVVAAPCGKLTNMSASEFAATRARDQAPKDLGGVYRFLLAMVPTGSVARMLPQLLTQVFNFSGTKVLLDEPGHVIAELTGLPEPLAPWMATIISAYGETALRTSGAKEASFVMKPGDFEGTAHGVRMVRYTADVRFR